MDLTIVSLEEMQFNSLLSNELKIPPKKDEQFKRIIVKSMIAAGGQDQPYGVIFPVSKSVH